ncbi:gas vesicle protein [Streptomyces sp. 184]
MPSGHASPQPGAQRQISLVDLLDRLLGTGVVIAGDLTLRIADVDLVRIRLQALLSSIGESMDSPWLDGEPLRPAGRKEQP